MERGLSDSVRSLRNVAAMTYSRRAKLRGGVGLGFVGLAVVIGMSGCSGEADNNEDDTGVAGTDPPYLGVYEADVSGGDASLISGTLTGNDECLYLDPENGGELTLLLFPRDEVGSLDTDDIGFRYQGEEHYEGDLIEVGGGGPSDLESARGNDNATIPDGCRDDVSVFWVASH